MNKTLSGWVEGGGQLQKNDYEHRLWTAHSKIWNTEQLSSCMTLGKLLNFPVLSFYVSKVNIVPVHISISY